MTWFEQCTLEFSDIKGGKISDKEYFKLPGISNSKLKLINPAENGSLELYLNGVPFEYNISLEVGTSIHNLLLEPESFILSDYDGKPTGKCGLFIDKIFKMRRKGIPLHKAIQLASEEADYYKGKLSAKIFRKALSNGLDYYLKRLHGEFTNESKEVIVLPKTQLDIVKKCVQSVQNNLVYKKLYSTDSFEHKDIYNEYSLAANIKVTLPDGSSCQIPFKGKLDSVVIDHNTKTIHLSDLKTTSKGIDYFMDAVVEDEVYNGTYTHHHYWRQCAIYLFLLQMHTDLNLYLNNYDLKCHMIVVETNGNFKSEVFNINNSYIQAGIKEFKELICRIAWYTINGYDQPFPEDL